MVGECGVEDGSGMFGPALSIVSGMQGRWRGNGCGDGMYMTSAQDKQVLGAVRHKAESSNVESSNSDELCKQQ
jgi:hypothetical protein